MMRALAVAAALAGLVLACAGDRPRPQQPSRDRPGDHYAGGSIHSNSFPGSYGGGSIHTAPGRY